MCVPPIYKETGLPNSSIKSKVAGLSIFHAYVFCIMLCRIMSGTAVYNRIKIICCFNDTWLARIALEVMSYVDDTLVYIFFF